MTQLSFIPSDPPERLAARRILAVTEEELQRIVLDVHDGPVQHVFAALSQVKALQHQWQLESLASVDGEQQLDRIASLLEAALHDIRNFIGTFRPPDFPRRSLSDILQTLVVQHEHFTACQVTLVVEQEQLPASMPVKIALYRICQEALANAYRHSGTTEHEVCLGREGNMIRLEVRDRGKGFVPPPLSGPEATERSEHIGLRGIRERIGLVGGTFELIAASGQGTTIRVKVPIDG